MVLVPQLDYHSHLILYIQVVHFTITSTTMRVICINNNGWHIYEGNYYGFVLPRPSEVSGPQYGVAYEVISSFIDKLGDMCYILNDYGDCGWEADCFMITGDTYSDFAHAIHSDADVLDNLWI